MAVDEAARHQLYRSLESTLGPEPTSTLMSLLPPVGWADVATRQDLHALENGLRSEIAELRAEMHREISGVRGEIAGVRGEIGELRAEMHREISGVRGEISGVRGEISGVRGEIAELRAEMHGEISGVRGEIAELRAEMHREISGVRGEISGVRGEIAELRAEMHTTIRNAVFSMIGAMFTLAALTVAATTVA